MSAPKRWKKPIRYGVTGQRRRFGAGQLQENEAAQRLEGTLSDVDGATAYLLGHRHGQVWSQTDKGWQPGGREQNPEAKSSNKYEKFAKALINASADDDSYAKPAGQLLEIVPLTNPATVNPGDELPVQVLYDGKPLNTAVYATFDGFSDTPGTYAYYTETLSEGEHADKAMIKLVVAGTWMVRAEHRVSGEQFDEHVMRAVLLFEVPESS
ncbi:MAG: DUF4198 domain-containing protein [Candidatus Competibacteraceae bacterium]|nr:DUF4198 domain-containing protein [Candidatus Competibacteraceae bacterium]